MKKVGKKLIGVAPGVAVTFGFLRSATAEMKEPFMYFHIPALPLHVTYTWILMLILVGSALIIRRSVKAIPSGGQNVCEAMFGGILDFTESVMGYQGRKYFPLLATLGVFIFAANVLGLIPGMFSPTTNINTTVACALTVFCMTHYVGFKAHGFGYIKQFTGPIWWLAPLMVVIELIGHLARPLSLSIRLFGNLFGKEQVLVNIIVLGVVLGVDKYLILPMLAPSLMIVFAIFLSFIQAFVFVLLSMIYLAGALEEHH